MKPDCIHCSRHLRLVSDEGSNYFWQCEAGCAERIDTGIATSISIELFLRDGIRDGDIDFSRYGSPLLKGYVAGARVHMPQILYHFIECTWGACYNHLYLNCIVPYLDCPAVVDYVLRTPVVYPSTNTWRGSTGALIYAELHFRLCSVRSPKIDDYLLCNFRRGRTTNHQ